MHVIKIYQASLPHTKQKLKAKYSYITDSAINIAREGRPGTEAMLLLLLSIVNNYRSVVCTCIYEFLIVH